MPLIDHSVKVLSATYEGDDANSKELDLGDDYDEVRIYLEESSDHAVTHLAQAYAVGTTYGNFWNDATTRVCHRAMGAADPMFQGKMTGGDANKVKLGSTGNDVAGTNKSGYTYRVLAKKYVNVVALP